MLKETIMTRERKKLWFKIVKLKAEFFFKSSSKDKHGYKSGIKDFKKLQLRSALVGAYRQTFQEPESICKSSCRNI